MKCPACHSINPDDALKCGCGYDFTAHTKALYRPITDMGVGEFFSNSWRAFGANWTTFITLAAIPTLVFLAAALATEVEVSSLPAVIIIWIVSMTVWILSTMALTMAAHKISDGQAIGVWESYNFSLGLFWRYVWTGMLYFFIVFGGLLLFIIPGIIWGIRYIFAPYLVIIEGIGGREALSRSKAVTKRRLSGIFGRELMLGLLFFLVVTIPLTLLILLIGVALGKPTIGFSEPNPEWALAIQQFGEIVSGALFVIFNVLLFKSIRALAIDEKALLKAGAASIRL